MSILSTSSKLVRVGDSYSAGEGISIENNVISVTGDYGHAYYAGDNITISDDNVISSKDWTSDIDTAAQNVSAETTAWVDSQNYLTDADMGDYALITDVETTSGLLKMDIDTVSASITGKMDSTAFNDWQNGQYANDIAGLSNDIDTVSGAVDAISGAVSSLDIPTHQEIIDASGYAYSQSTAWTDSQGYLTQHQDISYLATKNEVDTVSSFLSGAIDYVSANAGDEFPASANDAITAYQTYSGTYLTAHQSLSAYLTKTSADTLYQPIGDYALESDLLQVSSDLISAQSDIDYISANIPVIPDMSANEWNSVYDSVESNSGLWNEMSAYQNASGTYLTKSSADTLYQPIGSYASQSDLEQVSGDLKGDIDYVSANAITSLNGYATTSDLNTASGFLSGAIDYVSANAGTTIDTIDIAVISPLVTGFSGESAYLGIESTALNLSSYLPVSAVGYNSQGYVSGISGKNISAYYSRNSLTSNYSYTADRAYHDRNNNEITSYYQPKLIISGDAGTITAINGSAVGASIPEGWELVAGQGIEIVDDAENNQTTISVTAAGGNPEVESYVQTNSASIDDAVSTYQTNSGSYITQETDWTNTITAASSYAYSEAVAQIPADIATTGDINDLAQSISETYQPIGNYLTNADSANFYPMTGNPAGFLTSHQDISNKLDTTAFSDVSGTFLTAVNIPESASWEDATTAYQTNSASYLTSHQPISAEEWNSNYETVLSNSSTWTNGGFTGEVYGISGVSPNVDVYIDQQTLWISAGDFASQGDIDYLSGAIGDVETLLASL